MTVPELFKFRVVPAVTAEPVPIESALGPPNVPPRVFAPVVVSEVPDPVRVMLLLPCATDAVETLVADICAPVASTRAPADLAPTNTPETLVVVAASISLKVATVLLSDDWTMRFDGEAPLLNTAGPFPPSTVNVPF